MIIYTITGAGPERSEALPHLNVTIGSAPTCTIAVDDLAPRHVEIITHVDSVTVRPLDGIVTIDRQIIGEPTRIGLCTPIALGLTTITLRSERDRHSVASWRISAPAPLTELPPTDDPTERDLLAALRERPADIAMRLVYADWLESHDRLEDAAQLRGDRTRLGTSTAAWRAIACPATLSGCERCECPRRWDALVPTADARVRACATCASDVHYCVTRHELRGAMWRREIASVDPALESRITPARIEAVLQRIAPPEWTVEANTWTGSDRAWTVSQPGGIVEHGFVVLFAGHRLHVRYGGNDAGLWHPDMPPRHGEIELLLTGCDDQMIAEWLADAFATLPPTEWGYT